MSAARLLWGAAAFLTLALVVLWATQPKQLTVAIKPAQIAHLSGQPYSIGRLAPRWWLYVARDDGAHASDRSGVILYEDGVPLGPAHAPYPLMRETGRNAFSYWAGYLVFSSSDGTDPRTNGRRYVARVLAEINPLVLWWGLALTGLTIGAAAWTSRRFLIRRIATLLRLSIAAGRESLWTSVKPIRAWSRAGASLGVRSELPHFAAVALWPFVFLWAYVAGIVTPGNDFMYLYYNYKAYLVAGLAHGHFPLWAPAEAAGYPLLSNPFVAPFYPLNLVYAAHHLVLGGLSPWDYTLYTILGFSVYGLGLYCWFRRLGFDRAISLTAVLISLISLKVTELIRFPNAAHSAAWIPWLLYGATVGVDRRRLKTAAAIFGVACFMLLTAGYPYFVVYTAFLIGPYVLVLAWPRSRDILLHRAPKPDNVTSPALLLTWLAGSAGIAVGAASPWLSQVRTLMAQTVDRGVANFDYATEPHFGMLESVGSWIFPPASTNEGWHYFGMYSTILIGAYVAYAICAFKLSARERKLVLFVLAWIAAITYFTWGRDSLLFQSVWKHTPVLNQMRAWGRMNIILVPAIGLLLAMALAHYSRLLCTQNTTVSSQRRAFISLIAGGALLVFAAQILLIKMNALGGTWTEYFKLGASSWTEVYSGFPWNLVRHYDERSFLLATLVAGLCLVGLAVLSRRFAPRRLQSIALGLALTVSCVDLYVISNFQYMYPYIDLPRSSIDVRALVRQGFAAPRQPGSTTVDHRDGTQRFGLIPNWEFGRYAMFHSKYFDPNGVPLAGADPQQVGAALALLGADKAARRLFIVSRIGHELPADFLADARLVETDWSATLHLLGYDGDKLTLTTDVDASAWLCFIDNWDPHWRATVNGEPVGIERVFGTFKAVRVPAGRSKVVFTYSPWRWAEKR